MANAESACEQQTVPFSRGFPGLVCVEAWSKFPWLHAGFSTRLGGVSSVYGQNDLNLGWTEADSLEAVAQNRQRFFHEVVGTPDPELGTVRQFHSNVIRHVERGHGPLRTAAGKASLRGDALMTDVRGLLLGILTADCVPVLIADTKLRVVAAFHAGWRGTLDRIVERGIGDFRLRYGSKSEDLVAAIGPCIGACCFAVGEEVRSGFQSQFTYSDMLFSDVRGSEPVREKYPPLFLTGRTRGHPNVGPQIYLDLVQANRRQLLDAGVAESRIASIGECTSCAYVSGGKRKYFSHRSEHGITGRMMSVIGVAKT